MASTVASQQEGSNPRADWGPSVWSLPACLRGFSPGTLASSGFLPQSRDMQVRLIGVNVSVSGCLSLYVDPVTDWRPVQGVPRRSPNDSWDWLQQPRDPGIDNGWKDNISICTSRPSSYLTHSTKFKFRYRNQFSGEEKVGIVCRQSKMKQCVCAIDI